jgi:hypothetical protein
LSDNGAKSSRLKGDSVTFSESITETSGADAAAITGDGITEPDAVLHAGLEGFADFRSWVVNFGEKTESEISGSRSSWRRRRREQDILSAPR